MILLLVFAPFALLAQKPAETDITGLWKGTQYNDSTGLYYSYEVGISREKGKYTGFSHTWFILDDKKYYGVKELKIRIENNKVIMEDESLISNNYPVKPPKGVRMLSILDLEIKDSIMKLTGPFATNRTKNWASVTGTVSLQRKNDYWQSSLVPHLQELGVAQKLTFVEDTFGLTKNTIAVNIPRDKDISPTAAPSIKAPPKTMVENQPKTIPASAPPDPIAIVDVAKDKSIEVDKETIVKQNEEKKRAAAEVDKRTTVEQQTVFFKSDSLQLSLYDNGEVDGDTVSVLLNGTVIMEKQRLSTNAIRKTIYLEKSQDSIQLLMYAENLGTIAPNTGLLVVKDGKETYEVRFSGDLQKNAAVIFKRKK